jgi:hypothetical protein
VYVFERELFFSLPLGYRIDSRINRFGLGMLVYFLADSS